MSPLPATTRPESVSQLLRQMQDRLAHDETITVAEMLRLFGVRGFAFLLFILSLLNIVIFMVPGISLLFGVPMVILAVQMLLGNTTPISPRFVRHRTIKRSVLAHGLGLGIRAMEQVEHLIRPRFTALFGPYLDRIHSLLALVLAILVALPVPVLNVPPSVGMMALALGVMQRDGLFVVAAYAIAGWSLFLFKSVGLVAHNLVM